MDDVNATPAAKGKRARAVGAITPDLGSWLSSYNQALESWTQSGNGLVQKAAELSQEIMDFSQSRLRADLDAWEAITACRNPADFFECQRQFAQKATRDYFDEASKLVSRSLALMSEAAQPLHEERAAKA